MRGVIAAGSDITAAAGAEILERGGNAVDAAVAACLACAAGEPTLTSLAGGGMLLHRDGASGKVTACEFFSNAPGLGGAPPKEALDFFPVEVDFGPTTQTFYVGAASAAVPGAIPGLFSALERWGTLPLAEVIEPACASLREGVVLGAWHARAAALLTPILLHTDKGRAQFGVGDRLMAEGDRYRCPGLADTLEQMAKEGWRTIYDGPMREAMLAVNGKQAGGMLSAADLDAYEVVFREPLVFEYRGRRVYTNPPPGAGGELIALMLQLLETQDLEGVTFGSDEHVRLMTHAMRVAEEARLVPGGVDISKASIERWCARYAGAIDEPLRGPTSPGGSNSTTHVSVIDGAGNAATVTYSYGEGNGYLIGDTGIMMNNLMGEEDLFPNGFHSWPKGERLRTMMSPTIVECRDRGVVAMGTGGANRIRTAIVQVISNLADHQMSVQDATHAPRVHFEDGVLNVETFERHDQGQSLEVLGAPHMVAFPEPNLFFGGVHLVRRGHDGTITGAGDPRRGGVCRVV